MPRVSIIIRTRNEERWIAHCLRMVYKQSFEDFEVIIVDNESTDHTLTVARQFPVRVENIGRYRPGRALNVGIEASTGEYVACLSAHCVPKTTEWLASLMRNFEDEKIAGVYGRQLPVAFSSAADKRDLLITFGLDRRVQQKDAFFHNANSMVRREVWNEFPFDADVTNIEDRLWAKTVLSKGFQIVYDPAAEVYHHHGIHQGIDQARARNVVQVLEGIEAEEGINGLPEVYAPSSLKVVALLPILGEPERLGDRDLLQRCIRSLRENSLISRIVPIIERPDLVADRDVEKVICVARPPELQPPEESLVSVLRFGLEELERRGLIPDVVLYVNYLYPFRPVELFSTVIRQLLHSGMDTVLPAEIDLSGALWIKRDGKFTQVGMGIGTGLDAGQKREVIYRPIAGVGCATYPEYIRSGRLIGDRVELVPISHPLHSLKVRDDYSRWVAELSVKAFDDGSSELPRSSSSANRITASYS
jgi:rhamnosyltransferase